MRTHSKKLTGIIVLALTLMMGYAFTYNVSGEWVVPAEYKKKANPVASNEKSLKQGSELYSLHCKSCHGKYGEGDGPKAEGLEEFPGDFTAEEFQAQTDGELFYKTKFGRDEMPSYEKKIPYDDEIWAIVNYMRTFGE